MTTWRVRDAATGRLLASRIRRAEGWLDRTLGLLPRSAIAMDEGLWIPRCGAVHTLGMRVPLDIVFLDGDGRVIGVEAAVRPGRWHVGRSGAQAVAEFAAGFATAHALTAGTLLAFEPVVSASR
jgi:hypothetical protein